MKKVSLFIVAMVAFQVSVIAQTNFDFSAVCASGQTLYYQITDADAHEVALVHPASSGWGNYPRPQGDVVFPEIVEHDNEVYNIVAIADSAFVIAVALLAAWSCLTTSVPSVGWLSMAALVLRVP